MPSKLVTTVGGMSFWGNLDWRLLPPTTDKASALRTAATERGASHVACVQSRGKESVTKGKKSVQIHRHSAGFFLPTEGQSSPKKAHSFAACFAAWIREHHENAILYVQLPGPVKDGEEPRYAVVVVINGMPVLDKVEDSASQAYAMASTFLTSHPNISIFADDEQRFPRTLMAESLIEAVCNARDKTTAIAAAPPDVMMIAMVLVALMVVGGGYHFYKKHKVEEARKLAMIKAQQEDPVNLYLTGLSQVAGRAGLDPASVLKSIDQATKLPLKVEGWDLSKVACDMTATCEALYIRTTGTFKDLKAALPTLQLAAPTGTDLNKGVVTWDPGWALVGIGPETPLKPLPEFLQAVGGPQLQDWLVAGLSLQMQQSQLWPQVAGVPGNFKHPRAVGSGKLEVGGVTMPLVTEVVTKAPAGVMWTGWTVTVGDEKQDVLQRLQMKLEGFYYVQN